jgi:hypothetical protein
MIGTTAVYGEGCYMPRRTKTYEVSIFGPNPVHPSPYRFASTAIGRARRELEGQPGIAEGRVTEKPSGRVIWKGQRDDGGNITESNQ